MKLCRQLTAAETRHSFSLHPRPEEASFGEKTRSARQTRSKMAQLGSKCYHRRANFCLTWSLSLFDWSWQAVLMGSCKVKAETVQQHCPGFNPAPVVKGWIERASCSVRRGLYPGYHSARRLPLHEWETSCFFVKRHDRQVRQSVNGKRGGPLHFRSWLGWLPMRPIAAR
jgi:hypothetical protein